jgi:hypothetical protein
MRRLLAALALSLLAGAPAMATPEPSYTRVSATGGIEVRDYAPQIIAEVVVRGGRGEAASRGFRPLANFIFGANAPRAKIAMTAPVTQSPVGQKQGEKIAMTAPVLQTREGEPWRVGFIMPEGYTMETLPRPNDPNVRLREEPARRMAVIRFSGFAPEDRLDRQSEALERAVAAQGLRPVGAPIYAFYDPPWTPPWMRRNEIMVEVAR